jgi:hypothetical protein
MDQTDKDFSGTEYETIVSVSYAILIAVEEADDLSPCPFAEVELRALAKHLESVGIPKAHQTLLLGSAATRSAIESRLRRLSKALLPDDVVWFIFAGPGFKENEGSFLACADTLADDRAATALALADVVRQLHSARANCRFLLDAPGISNVELAGLFPASGTSAALTASDSDQASYAAGGRRLWLQLVGDALAGQASEALDADVLTAGALRDWTAKELPRLVRKAISSPQTQSPVLFGPPEAVLARIVAAPKPPAKLDLKKLKRIVFRGERRDRVKNLSAFQKNFKLPESASPSSQKWVYRLAADDLKAAVEATYNALREHLGFKRKDLETTVGTEGLGFIRAPTFDFSVSVSLDPDDPASVIWRREVSQISDPDVLASASFRTVFGGQLDTLQFEFEKIIDVDRLVDRIEDEPAAGVGVRVASDGSSCDVTVQGFAGRVHVERKCLRVEGPPGLSPTSLVEQFFAFQARFGGKKGLPALR